MRLSHRIRPTSTHQFDGATQFKYVNFADALRALQ